MFVKEIERQTSRNRKADCCTVRIMEECICRRDNNNNPFSSIDKMKKIGLILGGMC